MKLDPTKMKARRDKLQLGMTEAAGLVDMTPQQWNNLETGRRPDPRVSTMARIAKALRCPIESLIGEPTAAFALKDSLPTMEDDNASAGDFNAPTSGDDRFNRG